MGGGADSLIVLAKIKGYCRKPGETSGYYMKIETVIYVYKSFLLKYKLNLKNMSRGPPHATMRVNPNTFSIYRQNMCAMQPPPQDHCKFDLRKTT